MIKPLKIGAFTLKNRYILAPMAGYTGFPLRQLAREAGAALTYTEMISAAALVYGNRKTMDMLPHTREDGPLALQLFGGDAQTVFDSVPIVEKAAVYDFLDFNMGCPVPKVMRQKAGSYWLRRQDEIYKLLRTLVTISAHPVLVKIRLGFSKDDINAAEVARLAEEAGVQAVAVHGRTRDQYYEGVPDYGEIAKVKAAVSIPVIANGNIGLENIGMVMDETGADGFMIGRGALGDPLIFTDLLNLEDGRVFKPRSPEVQIRLLARHFKLVLSEMGERNAVRYFRGLAVLYVKGFPDARELRQRLIKLNSSAEYESFINECLGKFEHK